MPKITENSFLLNFIQNISKPNTPIISMKRIIKKIVGLKLLFFKNNKAIVDISLLKNKTLIYETILKNKISGIRNIAPKTPSQIFCILLNIFFIH